METREEYVVITAKRYGSDTYFYDYKFDIKTDRYQRQGGYYYIPYSHRFVSKESAGNFLNNLISNGVCNPYKVCHVTDEAEVRKIMCNKETQYKEVAFIVRVPEEFYLGKEWSKTLKYMGDTRYNDDKPYQLYGHETADIFAKDKWLVYNSPEDFHWVENRFDATFFSKEDAMCVQKTINDLRAKEVPYKGYVGGTSLPLRIENEKPRFQKGDNVILLRNERMNNSFRYKGYTGEITDIKVERDKNGEKQFVYAFSDNPYVDDFLESDYFLTREEITAKGGKFYRGIHSGCNTELLDYNDRTYVLY